MKDAYGPDYVLVQCGVDGLAGDPCAVWNWSLDDGKGSLGWCLARIVNEWRGRKLILGGGTSLDLVILTAVFYAGLQVAIILPMLPVLGHI